MENPGFKTKQAVTLQACRAASEQQQFRVENGMIKTRAADDVCVFWAIRPKTRLWTAGCAEFMLGEIYTDVDSNLIDWDAIQERTEDTSASTYSTTTVQDTTTSVRVL